METCCWNMKNGIAYHNGDCFKAFGPRHEDATLVVTFMDGETIIYKNVRVCINRPHDDGIRVDGTTLYFETMDVTFTALGVRQYTYTLD